MDTINIKKVDGYPAIEPKPLSIPEELKVLPWAVWIAEPRSGKPGKFDKAPRNPSNGIKIGANDPSNFGTFEQAAAALETGKYSGIGVLLTDNSGIVGIDIDDYTSTVKENPAVHAWVDRVRTAGAYYEKSPSGQGLRLFVRGALPGKGRKHGGLEIYADKRFLTVTGKGAKISRSTLIDGQESINSFLSLLPSESRKTAPTNYGNAPADPNKVRELCELVEGVRPALWGGLWENLEQGYPSQSEADMALIGTIARKALDVGTAPEALADTVKEVFARSGLYRGEKLHAIEGYAIPKAIAETMSYRASIAQAADAVSETSAGADLAESVPGDTMAGRQYARAMRGKLLYVTPAGRYLRWGGSTWEWCGCSEEMAAAKKVASKILDYAVTLYKADPDKHKRLLAFATSLQNLRRLEAMIELAKSEEGMSMGHMSELDADQWLLGVRNGVVDLRTGALLSADPKMLITRQCAAEYHHDAECPRWLKFLDEVFEGDQDTIASVQRALGYTLTGSTTEEVMFICVGFGANGKSVFSNTVNTIFGGYARTAPSSLLTIRRADDTGPRNDLAMLCGARSVSINETQTGDRLDEQIVKQLAGREMISARYLHKEFFDFVPTAKAWLRTNHRPIITGEDDGIWRRILLIPFRRKFEEHERDPWLESKLLDERDGILAWMVRGCLDWKRAGLKPSPTIRRESATYRKESDLLGEYLEDRAQSDPDARIEQRALFFDYQQWHNENGTRAGSKTSFSRKLKERGYGEVRSNNKRFYAGLTVKLMT